MGSPIFTGLISGISFIEPVGCRSNSRDRFARV
jgi:hypothetical protein